MNLECFVQIHTNYCQQLVDVCAFHDEKSVIGGSNGGEYQAIGPVQHAQIYSYYTHSSTY